MAQTLLDATTGEVEAVTAFKAVLAAARSLDSG